MSLHEEVIQSPSFIEFSCSSSVRPESECFGIRVEVSIDIHKVKRGEEGSEALSFLWSKAAGCVKSGRGMDVDLLMRHIHVATQNDTFTFPCILAGC